MRSPVADHFPLSTTPLASTSTRLSPLPAQSGTVAPCPGCSIIPVPPPTEAAHMQAIKGNLLTAEEIATFEREGWSPARRRAHILQRIEDRGLVAAAE